jgi:hypothetical protein
MKPITRSRASKPVMTVDEAVAGDRKYFDEHPDENEYIREFVPGEFGAAELPGIPPGFRTNCPPSTTEDSTSPMAA